jgi:hypothetical protein
MFLIYVDESGDNGLNNSPSKYFVLSALIMHENVWQDFLNDLINFRRALKLRYGLKMSEEIHASEFINGYPKLKQSITRNDKLDLLKKCLKWLDERNDISIITIKCDKSKNSNKDIFEYTWGVLFQRIDQTLNKNNFPNSTGGDKGMIIADNTDGGKLTKLLRKMRRFNLVPNAMYFGAGSRNMPLRSIIEDPVLRNSANSYLHQMVDVVVYFARQYFEPNKYVRGKGARTFYINFLQNVTNPYATKNPSPNNIVEI